MKLENQHITSSLEDITPAKAKEMLGTSNGNRTLKRVKVDGYARDMAAGKWQTNGETLIVDQYGSLIDGHHRLTACVKSGVSFQALVVRGVSSDSQKTVDMGASRTASDALGFYGITNSNLVSTIVRILLSLREGKPKSTSPSTQEVFSFLEEHDISEAASFASHKHFPRSSGLVGALHYIGQVTGEKDKAIAFAEVLKNGVPAYPGCAAHVLRERVTRDAMKGKPVNVRELHRIFFAAWEKFRVQVPVKQIRAGDDYRATGWTE